MTDTEYKNNWSPDYTALVNMRLILVSNPSATSNFKKRHRNKQNHLTVSYQLILWTCGRSITGNGHKIAKSNSGTNYNVQFQTITLTDSEPVVFYYSQTTGTAVPVWSQFMFLSGWTVESLCRLLQRTESSLPAPATHEGGWGVGRAPYQALTRQTQVVIPHSNTHHHLSPQRAQYVVRSISHMVIFTL
jgi:hypothetical protein